MRLLANLTASKPEAVVGASGAVPAAALAMAVHWEDSGLVWLGARVLANVAELATGVLAVCDAGGAAAVVCALEAHGTEEEVQAEGCRALANLAFDAPDSSAKHGESEAPTWREVGKAAVQEALRQQGLQATETRAAALEVTAAEAYLRLTGDNDGRAAGGPEQAPMPPARRGGRCRCLRRDCRNGSDHRGRRARPGCPSSAGGASLRRRRLRRRHWLAQAAREFSEPDASRAGWAGRLWRRPGV